MSALDPQSGHRFSFGLDAPGPHGGYGAEPWDLVAAVGDLGAWGVSVHDDDIAPPGSSVAERDDAVDRLRKALDETGMVVSMTITDLARDEVFSHGAFTAADRDVRRYAIRKAMKAIDLGAELGASTHGFRTCGGGRVATATAPLDALARYREAIDFLCNYVDDRGYDVRLTLQPATDARRRDALLPTAGHVLAFIATLDRPELVGLDAEAAIDEPGGERNALRGIAQAIDAGKLCHLQLHPSAVPDVDGPGRFGSEHPVDAFALVRLLEASGYDGARHFRVDAALAGDVERLARFASGCMRTYLALLNKTRRFTDDPEVADALAECGAGELADATVGYFSPDAAEALAAEPFDPEALAARAYSGDHLEQRIGELILGLR